MTTAPSKRALDVVLSGAGLLASAPVALALAVLIKLEDGGPIFFTQERVGKNGRLFLALKFRSMVPDAERDLEETSRLELALPAVEGLGDSALVPVELHSRLSELGTLELWMQRKDADDRWQLGFDVRTA